MFKNVATNQRKRMFSDVIIGAAMALGVALAVVSIDSAASTPADVSATPSQCELPYADQVAKKASGEMPDDLVC